jgi:hypothetical protein
MKRPSGKFVIRMPAALHGRLKEEAVRTGRSLNQVCLARLQSENRCLPGTAIHACSPILPDFLERIKGFWRQQLAGLILFGSAARGDATEGSDIDLLLVMRTEIKITRGLYSAWDELCREYQGAQPIGRVEPQFVRLPESPEDAGGLWFEAAIEGTVLWEDDGLLSPFLQSLRRVMAHGRIRRRVLNGSPYWIRESGESDA